MASTCPHGFTTGTCLICQTLEPNTSPGAPKEATSRRSSRTARATRTNRASRSLDTAGQAQMPVEPTSPRVLPPEARISRIPLGLRVGTLLIGAVIVVMLAWTAFHLVFAILHILELVGVAVVTGYLAWKAGVHHGRRTPASPKR